jgi:hypothetical protein
MSRRFHRRLSLSLCAFSLFVVSTSAQQKQSGPSDPPDTETGDLVKAVQNPVASLISVPIQNNINPDIGPNGRVQNVLNIQPVIPISITENWNLIARIITPIISQPDTAQKDSSVSGLGDINPSFFLSPVKVHTLIWGVGPALVLPTATNAALGQGKWSMGPSVVGLVQPGPWTIGALLNNVWSVGGQLNRTAVNQMLLQYFINYNLDKGWYLTSSPIITANWKAPSGDQWIVPVGGGIGRVFRLGPQPVNASVTVFGNAARPSSIPSSSWSLRLQLAFLYPKK